MPVTIDQNGIPTINSFGTLTAAEKSEIIQSPAQPEVTFASLLRGFMDVADDPFIAVIDPVTRKFRALESPTAQLAAAKHIELNPSAGQTGRSLSWGQASVGSPDAALDAAVVSIRGSVLPKMTVESLVSRILAVIPEAMQDKCLIEVNQTSETVTIHQYADAAARAAASAAVSVGSATGIVVTLAEPSDPGNPAALIFEGGSTS